MRFRAPEAKGSRCPASQTAGQRRGWRRAELGHLEGKKITALAGLAPMTQQSGKWQGKERITGGRSSIRRAIYMPALVAIRFNRDLHDKYQQLLKAGKAKKVAITAIMRRIIVLANTLLRERRDWLPDRP